MEKWVGRLEEKTKVRDGNERGRGRVEGREKLVTRLPFMCFVYFFAVRLIMVMVTKMMMTVMVTLQVIASCVLYIM